MGTDLIFRAEEVCLTRARQAFAAILLLADRLEPQLTTYAHPGWAPSDIMRVNDLAGGSPVSVSQAAIDVISFGKNISYETGGKVNIAIGPITRLWRVEQQMGHIPSRQAISYARRFIQVADIEIDKNKKTVRLQFPEMYLDVAGIAKGYVVALMGDLLREMKIPRFLISAGGDMALEMGPSEKPFALGVRDPRGLLADDILGILTVSTRGLSTAGDYERGFSKDNKRYHHVLDPETGAPSVRARAAVVMCESTLLSDTYDEVLMISGAQEGLQFLRGRAEGLVVDHEGKTFLSNGLFFTTATKTLRN